MTTDNSSAHKAQDPTTSNISFDDYGRWDDYAHAMIAEIQKTYEITGDSKAADAAYCRLRDEREAREDAGIVDPPRDWLDDLNNIGTGGTADELDAPAEAVAPAVVEPAGELDAAGEQAVEGFIAVAEAYEHQTDKPATNLTVEIQKYRARTLVADCKEFGVDPADPMAEQKVKVARTVKKFKATLADLEAFCPEFWKLPLKTMPKEGRKSRAWVLKNFKWRRYDEVTSTERTKLEDDKRLKKREAKIVAKGWRADFYDLSPADQKRERDRVWRQNKRTS
jgi:hypothetical protein